MKVRDLVIVSLIDEVERQDAHADQIGSVDALKGLGDHRLHAKETGALGGPVAGGPHAIVAAADHYERGAVRLVGLGGIMNMGGGSSVGRFRQGKVRNLPRSMVDGVAPFRSGDHEVLDPHVTEGAAGHHPVVSTPGTEGIELGFLHSVFEEITSGRGILLDGTGGRNVVGGDRVTKNAQRAGIDDVDDVARGPGEAIEEGRVLDIGRGFVPLVGGACLARDLAPFGIGGIKIAVKLVEDLGVEGRLQLFPDLGMRGPDVLQEDRVAVLIAGERFGGEIQVDPSGQGVGHHQGRGHEEIGPDRAVDPGLKVAVSGKDGGTYEISLLERGLDSRMERTRVADAGRASVAHGLEAELVELRTQAGSVKVVAYHAGTGRQGCFHIGCNGKALLVRFFRQEPGGQHDTRVGGVGAAGDGGDEDRSVADGGVRIDRGDGLVLEDGRVEFAGRAVEVYSHAGVAFVSGLAETSLGGGSSEEFVETLAEVGYFDAILGTFRTGDGGPNGGQVQFQEIGVVACSLVRDAEHVLGLEVVPDGLAEGGVASRARQIVDRFLVHREETHGGPVFRRHVGDGGAVRQGEVLRTRAVEFDELAHHAVLPQHLREVQGQVGGGDSLRKLTVQADTHHFRDEEGDRLAEHAGLRFDSAHAPAHRASSIDHGGVRVGADQSVGIVDAVPGKDPLGQILQVDLVDDPDPGRNDREGVEGLLAPLEELVTLAIADKLDFHVAVERLRRTREIDLHGVIDHQIDRYERFDGARFRALLHRSVTHGGHIDQEGNSGEVLQHDTRDRKGNFIVAGRPGLPVGQVPDILLRDFFAVDIAQDGFKDNPDGDRKAREIRESLLGKGGERVELSLGAGAGRESAEGVHGRIN